MTKREMAALCCKVLAIYAIIEAIKSAQYFMAPFWVATQAGGFDLESFVLLLSALIPIAQAGAGVWLWRRSGIVAAWMTGHDLQDDPDEPEAQRVRADHAAVQAVVISSLGVWVLIEAIPNLGGFLVSLVQARFTLPASGVYMFNAYLPRYALNEAIRFVIGIWLIFGADGIVRMLSRLRQAGVRPRASDETRDQSSSG